MLMHSQHASVGRHFTEHRYAALFNAPQPSNAVPEESASLKKLVNEPLNQPLNATLTKPAARVIFGVIANRKPNYMNVLKAHFDTWAPRVLSEGRYMAVVGAGNETLPQEYRSAFVETSCLDTYDGIACKEFENQQEAIRRNADWLVILGEDNYVDTKRMEEKLAKLYVDHLEYEASPIAAGIVG